jgi:DNA polymerase-3 subunit gamma/tau
MPEILYRKWRPRTFGEVAGQEHVATTLKNALATGRFSHAYLFAGPRGTGKTSTGRLLGKALNCTNRQGGEPCNECESCQNYLAGRAMDLIELDAASNRGIDEIRSLRDKVAFAPGAGEYKVYLIDEVHMLTDAAFNALLKTLEEPPPHVVFVLATTEAHMLPATIASRCQRFDFRRIPLTAAIGRLQTIAAGESIQVEPAALELIARSATGSLRDSTNLLDQLATSYGNDLTVEHVRAGLGLIGDERAGHLARMALNADLAGGLTLIASVRDDGLDLRQFQREIINELRDLLMVKSGLDPAEGATAERLQELRNAVESISTARLLTALRAFGEADLKQDPNSTLPLDIALAECALADSQPATAGAVEPPSAARSSNGQAVARPAPSTPVSRGAGSPARETGYSWQSPSDAETGTSPVIPSSPKPVEPVADPVSSEPVANPVRSEPGSPEQGQKVKGNIERSTSAPEGGPDEPSEIPAEFTRSAPAPESKNGQAAGSLALVRNQMRPIYEKARATGFQLGALLNSGCDVIEVSEGGIVLGFRHAIHAGKASEKQNLEALGAIVSEVLGMPTTVRCVEAPEVTPWNQRETVARNPLVRAAQEMGARILNETEEPPAPEDR